MQFADVSFALLQNIVRWRSPVPWIDAASYQAVYRCELQNAVNMSHFAANTTRLQDSNSKRPTYSTQILSHRGAFTKTHCFHKTFAHTHAFTQRWFYTHQYLHAQVFLHRDTFTQKSFTNRHAGTSTHRCLHTAMLLQRNAFTRTCFCTELLLTQSSVYTQKPLQ